MNNRRACTWKNVNHFAQCMHFTRYRCFFPIACARCSPWCIVTSINNVFWFIQTTEFVCSSDRLKLKGCIVAHRRIKIFTISIFGLDVKFHSTNIHRNIDLIICQTLMSFLVRIYVIHVWWFIHRLLIFYCTLPLSLSLSAREYNAIRKLFLYSIGTGDNTFSPILTLHVYMYRQTVRNRFAR